MQKCWLLILLLLSYRADAQRGMLFIKKKGYKKVAEFAEGQQISFQKVNGEFVKGMIWIVRKDSILVDGNLHAVSSISRIILRPKNNKLAKELLITTGAIVATSACMRLAKWSEFSSAMAYNSTMGYGNILIRTIPKIKRRQYRIGKKYSIQPLDLHF
ncbi:MAG: hypothetical protein ACXWV0_02335 [Flavisolibacter sp.]